MGTSQTCHGREVELLFIPDLGGQNDTSMDVSLQQTGRVYEAADEAEEKGRRPQCSSRETCAQQREALLQLRCLAVLGETLFGEALDVRSFNSGLLVGEGNGGAARTPRAALELQTRS